jgi:NAD(P)-dependent dehydrogenase (short-subunit alcohol dehydrogenase family)
MSLLRFDDRVVVVTGAGRGIGRGYALLLAERGARVVVADLGGDIAGRSGSTGPADDVVAEIEASGGTAAACYASVADEAAAASIVDTALERFGRIDAVINNAGIHDPGAFDELTSEQFRAMLDVHLFGTIHVTRAAWPHFRAAGYGRVVNTTSEAVLGGLPDHTSYAAAKGAVWALTRNLATEGEAHGIKVNAVAPRAYTRMSAAHSAELAAYLSMSDEEIGAVNASMPPDLCAPAAAFLAHECCELTGEVLQTGMGGVSRLAITHTVGIAKDPLSIEDVAESLGSIMDLTGATVTDAHPLGN